MDDNSRLKCFRTQITFFQPPKAGLENKESFKKHHEVSHLSRLELGYIHDRAGEESLNMRINYCKCSELNTVQCTLQSLATTTNNSSSRKDIFLNYKLFSRHQKLVGKTKGSVKHHEVPTIHAMNTHIIIH